VNVSGTIEAGVGPATGIMTTGDLSFGSGGILAVQMNGTTAGSGYDQLSVTNVDLTNAMLAANLGSGFNPAGGTTFEIISNTGSNPVTNTFTGLPEGSVVMIGGQAFTISYVGGDGNDVTLTKVGSQAPPSITSVIINEDLSALYNAAGQPFAGAQRSMVNDIVYSFSEAVNIVAPGTEPNVFTIAVASGWTGTPPTLSWAPVAGSGNTEWAISFTGGSITGGSIANGAYTITVNDPSAITAVSDSQALSLAGSGIGSATQSFYRLFGDINGDKFVNAADNVKFKNALTTYNAAFDYSQDGFVNASDNVRFKNDLTVNFSGFTPTI
jgi:Dockerin type I domain